MISIRRMLLNLKALPIDHKVRVPLCDIRRLIRSHLKQLYQNLMPEEWLKRVNDAEFLALVFPIFAVALISVDSVALPAGVETLEDCWQLLGRKWAKFDEYSTLLKLWKAVNFRDLGVLKDNHGFLVDMDKAYVTEVDGENVIAPAEDGVNGSSGKRVELGYVNWHAISDLTRTRNQSDLRLVPLRYHINGRETGDGKCAEWIVTPGIRQDPHAWYVREQRMTKRGQFDVAGPCQRCNATDIPCLPFCVVPKELLSMYENCMKQLRCGCRHVWFCAPCTARARQFLETVKQYLAKRDYQIERKMIPKQPVPDPSPFEGKKFDLSLFLADRYMGAATDISNLVISEDQSPRRSRRLSSESSHSQGSLAVRILNESDMLPRSNLNPTSETGNMNASMSSLDTSFQSVSEGGEDAKFDAKEMYKRYCDAPMGIVRMDQFFRDVFAKKFRLAEGSTQGFRRYMNLGRCITDYNRKLRGFYPEPVE